MFVTRSRHEEIQFHGKVNQEKYKQAQENLRTIYKESHAWVIAANRYSYMSLHIFGSISIGSIYFMMAEPDNSYFFALGALFTWWMAYRLIIHLGKSVQQARDVMTKIEIKWSFHDELRVISKIGPIWISSGKILNYATAFHTIITVMAAFSQDIGNIILFFTK